jgi:DNA ligase-1
MLPLVMLANRFSGQDVAGWWLSEKFDGVRAFWDGEAIRTRSWRAVAAPKSFTAQLPRGIALDGELWSGRGTFQIASELSRFERAQDSAWLGMRFMAFDVPTCDAIPFEQRIAKLAVFANQIVQVVPVRRCESGQDAVAAMHEIVRGGGEGCVLKCPGHCYEFARSSAWLKVKPVGVE